VDVFAIYVHDVAGPCTAILALHMALFQATKLNAYAIPRQFS